MCGKVVAEEWRIFKYSQLSCKQTLAGNWEKSPLTRIIPVRKKG